MPRHPDSRRRFLKAAVPAGMLSIATTAGLLKPGTAFAWFPFFNVNPPPARPNTPPTAVTPAFSGMQPRQPPRPQTPLEILIDEMRRARPETNAAVDLISPDIAVDGASIMLEIQALLPEVDGLAVYIENNPQPLAATFHLSPNTLPEIKLLVRLAQSSNIRIVARSQGRFYQNLKFVKVTQGGCSDSFDQTATKHRQEVDSQRRYRAAPY